MTYFVLTIGFIGLNHGQEQNTLLLFPKQSQWINPALIGQEKETNFGLIIDSQWLGIKNAPKQQSLFFENFNAEKRINTGGLIRNRSRFAESSIQFFGQCSYSFKLNSSFLMGLGIQGGGDFIELNFDYLHSIDGVSVDPLLQKQSYFIPNLGIGFFLKFSNYTFHGALPRLLERFTFQKKSILYFSDRFYFFTELAWSQKKIGNISPFSLSLQFHNLGLNEFILQAKGSYILDFGKIYLGINSAENMGLGFLFHSKKALNLGYAFHFPIRTQSDLKLNNHSIYLQFKLKKQEFRR